MATQNPKLCSIQLKTQRAREHIRNLELILRAFFRANPYQVRTKRDNANRLVYYVSSVQLMPVSIPLIAGDAIQNLGSTLDHLAWQLYQIGAGSTARDERIYFPITENAANYSRILTKLGGTLRADAIGIFNSIQPYKNGSEHNLWLLHKLNNIDKHRLLVTVGSAFYSLNLGAYMVANMEKSLGRELPKLDAFFKPKDNMFPLKTGAELFVDLPNAEVSKELQFRFGVVFNEVGIIEGELVLDKIRELFSAVDNTVKLFLPCLT